MKRLSRDVVLTLLVKCTLLLTLWWVCFKDVPKPKQTSQQWLLGVTTKSDIFFPSKTR